MLYVPSILITIDFVIGSIAKTSPSKTFPFWECILIMLPSIVLNKSKKREQSNLRCSNKIQQLTKTFHTTIFENARKLARQLRSDSIAVAEILQNVDALFWWDRFKGQELMGKGLRGHILGLWRLHKLATFLVCTNSITLPASSNAGEDHFVLATIRSKWRQWSLWLWV